MNEYEVGEKTVFDNIKNKQKLLNLLEHHTVEVKVCLKVSYFKY